VPPAAVPDVDLTGYVVGLTVPVGPTLLRAAYSRVKYDYNMVARPDATAGKLALGFGYNLSKRTVLYATAARISTRNGAALTVGGPDFISNAGFVPKRSTGSRRRDRAGCASGCLVRRLRPPRPDR
jgi:hypothetical protein